MNLLFKIFLFWISFISIKIYSQEFYVNTTSNINNNEIYKLNVINPSEIPVPFCSPTVNTFQIYQDIAIDSNNNVYYVTSDGLLYRKNSNNSNCEFLGNFTNSSSNSLVADSGSFIYSVGVNKLDKYDINSGTFSEVGQLPSGYTSTGDLFFFESRLFLTTSNSRILEINLLNPSQSCLFTTLTNISSYAAFSINYGTYSKAYIINNAINYPYNSTLHELDINTKQLGNTIRTYNHKINGAATAYNLTSTNSSCTPTLSTQENKSNNDYFKIVNPAKNVIFVETTIKRNDIIAINLFDNTGKKVKDFSNQNKLEKLNISGINTGSYLLTFKIKNGEMFTKKVMIYN
jgi:hypothetical protein